MGIGTLRRHYKPALQGAAAVTAAAPSKRASKSIWEAFVVSLGLSADGTKDELIAVVDEHVASLTAAEAAAEPVADRSVVVETLDDEPAPVDESGVLVLAAADEPVPDDAVVLDADVVDESADSN